jgi:phage gpG-like protein
MGAERVTSSDTYDGRWSPKRGKPQTERTLYLLFTIYDSRFFDMSEGFSGLDSALRRLGKLATDVRRVERPLKAIGVYLVGSVQKTIRAGGRPKPFTPLAASTIAARRKGKGRGGAKTLINTGRLLSSIDSQPVSSGGRPGVAVGTNVSYAAVQHFGGKKTYTIVAKNKKGLAFMGSGGERIVRRRVKHPPLKPRPFMVFQIPADEIKAAEIIGQHLARK